MGLYQLTDTHILHKLLQPRKVIPEPESAHLKTTPHGNRESHWYEGFSVGQFIWFLTLLNYIAGGSGSFLGQDNTLSSPG